MPSIIKAGNATTGLAMSSDGTGTLEIKTGVGVGTNAITIDASQAVTLPGNLTVTGTITGGTIVGAGGNYIVNSYTGPATWTKSPTLKAVQITVIGAGGRGGNTIFTNAVASTAGMGGGGGGGYSVRYLSAPAIPGPVAVTAGPLSTSSFGAFVSATAGVSGTDMNPSGNGTAGGAGGTGSSGYINLTGGRGGDGATGGPGVSGAGGIGAGFWSNPAAAVSGNTVGNSASPTAFGSGGGGASRFNPPGQQPFAGGAGAPGIVIIEEFY